MTLKDLNKGIWENFRNHLLLKNLAKSSVNVFIVYASQMYKWLANNELPIFNHISQLKSLDTSKQESKFKTIKPKTLLDLFNTLEANKERYPRLYLSLLLIYENLLRPVQVCKIKYKHIDLENNIITQIYNAKNKRYRSIVVTEKVAELIQKIIDNTIKKGIKLDDELFLIGGYNVLKEGKSNSPQSIRKAFVIFKEEFPEFKGMKPYEQKKTSITEQFKDKEFPPDEIRQRAGHSKLETTQIYNQDEQLTKPYKLKGL